MQILIKNGTIVNPEGRARLDVLIEEGRIREIAQGISAPGAMLIDAAGCYVLPGFIDTHTHFDLNTGSAVTADDFITGSRAAALGGTTAVLDFATQERDVTLQQALEEWKEKAQGSSINYGFHMAVARWDEGVRREMSAMTEQGVTSYKVYMVYDALRVNDGEIFQALQESVRQGALVGAHCENWDVLLQMVKEVKEGGITEPYGHPLSRPAAVEAEAVNRFLRIAQLADAPAYVVHLSTEQGLVEARSARARGQRVFLETCPQYLLLTDQRYRDEDGSKYVMSPPLRKSWDNEALWKGLAEGEIQTIGTDHCSFTMAQKAMGKDDFSKIPNGAPGVQHRSQLIYTYGVCEGRISLERMVALLSSNAAQLFGMEDRGRVAEGMVADVLVWDPSYTGCITDTNHAHNCDNSPYAGFAVQGRARDVLVNGELVVEGGEFVRPGQGKYIHRSRCATN